MHFLLVVLLAWGFRAQHDMMNDLRKGHLGFCRGIDRDREKWRTDTNSTRAFTWRSSLRVCATNSQQRFYVFSPAFSCLFFARFILGCMSSSGTRSLLLLLHSSSTFDFTITTKKEIAKTVFLLFTFFLLFEKRARGNFCLHSKWDIFMRFKLELADAFHHLASAFKIS